MVYSPNTISVESADCSFLGRTGIPLCGSRTKTSLPHAYSGHKPSQSFLSKQFLRNALQGSLAIWILPGWLTNTTQCGCYWLWVTSAPYGFSSNTAILQGIMSLRFPGQLSGILRSYPLPSSDTLQGLPCHGNEIWEKLSTIFSMLWGWSSQFEYTRIYMYTHAGLHTLP